MDVNAISQGGQFNYTSKPLEGAQIDRSLPLSEINVNVEVVKEENLKEEDIKKAVDKLNKFLEDEGTYAEYNVHEKFNTIMIKIIDKKTKEIVVEVPPKKILDMVAKMCEMVGVLLDEKA